MKSEIRESLDRLPIISEENISSKNGAQIKPIEIALVTTSEHPHGFNVYSFGVLNSKNLELLCGLEFTPNKTLRIPFEEIKDYRAVERIYSDY